MQGFFCRRPGASCLSRKLCRDNDASLSVFEEHQGYQAKVECGAEDAVSEEEAEQTCHVQTGMLAKLLMFVACSPQNCRHEVKTIACQCCGSEHGMFICHGNGWSFVQTGNFGVGELCFITITMNKLSFTIRFLFIDRFLVRAPIEPKFDKRGGA